ncbi:hypothetical protein MRX96_050767 [Rhipicephalus microplus]
MAASRKDAFVKMPVKFSSDSRSSHVMLFKEHSVREKSEHKPSGRTLFVVNVPPYCDEDSLKRIFGDCGKGLQMTGFKVAYVVFHKEAAVGRALALSLSEPRVLHHEDCNDVVGVAKWCAQYKSTFVDAEKVQKEVDTYMADYDARLEEEKQRAKAMDGVPDEDGWITVTKYGKRPVIPRTDAVSQKISSAEKKKRSQKELVNFYSFQIRESKMEKIAQLRKEVRRG